MLKLNLKNCCGIFSDSIVIFSPHDCVCSRVAFVILGKMGVRICLKILYKDYKDKVKRLLSVMLPIIGTQIAIMGMNIF